MWADVQRSRKERNFKEEESKEERVEKERQAKYNFPCFHGGGSLIDGSI